MLEDLSLAIAYFDDIIIYSKPSKEHWILNSKSFTNHVMQN